MHFTLQWRPAPAGPDPAPEQVAAALARAAAEALLTRAGADPLAFHYENPRTRVAADLAVGPGIAARIPLPRARFHLLEVEDLLRRVQGELGGEVVALGLEAHEGDWAAANRLALAALGPRAAEYAPLPPEHGEAWWRFTMARQAFRLAWPSADVIIPDLMLVRPREGGPAARLVVWPEQASSLVLPEAEFVAIRRAPRPFAPDPQPPAGLIPWADAVAALGDALERHETPLPHWLYRGGEAHPLRIRALLDLARVPGSAYRPVPADRVVDGP
nr:MAG: hypothetical protein DIU70_01715 [Bacillota bacterium]